MSKSHTYMPRTHHVLALNDYIMHKHPQKLIAIGVGILQDHQVLNKLLDPSFRGYTYKDTTIPRGYLESVYRVLVEFYNNFERRLEGENDIPIAMTFTVSTSNINFYRAMKHIGKAVKLHQEHLRDPMLIEITPDEELWYTMRSHRDIGIAIIELLTKHSKSCNTTFEIIPHQVRKKDKDLQDSRIQGINKTGRVIYKKILELVQKETQLPNLKQSTINGWNWDKDSSR